MSIREAINEINNSETSYCDICSEVIRNLDHAVLLTQTDRLIFDCGVEHKNKELLLVCDSCFENLVYEFKVFRGVKYTT